MSAEAQKKRAAETALQFLPQEGIVGLGTGSTARHFINAVAERVAQGQKLLGVATSQASRAQAEAAGIEVLPDAGPWKIDICVDGADEVSSELHLIKGGGGCHVREMIVNQASARNIIIVDESKLSDQLGEKWPVPLEILPFGRGSIESELEQLGRVNRRNRPNGEPWVTDSGNLIVDLHCGIVRDPGQLQVQLLKIPGVVGTGLFVARADLVLVAGAHEVRQLTAPGKSEVSDWRASFREQSN